MSFHALFSASEKFQQSFDADIDEGRHEMAMQCSGQMKVRGTRKCQALQATDKQPPMDV